jgi:signal transduction histidine kinase
VKIRERLAFRFMVVSALVTGAILLFIYIITRGFLHADFIDRLTQQSSLEVLHYATPQVRDVMPAGSFNLVNPATSIFSENLKLLHSQGTYPIEKEWILSLKQAGVFNMERDQYTIVGRKHEVNGTLYLVFVSDKDLPGQRELDFLVKAILVGWSISLVLSYFTGLYFSGNALRPVKRVVREVNQITEENLGYRLGFGKEVPEGDEMDELVITFNALLNRIERAFIAQRRFVQNASHELKTPLTAIMAEVELALARDRLPQEYQRILKVVMSETERLASITEGLLTLARLEEGSLKTEMDTIDVVRLLDDTLSLFRLHHPDRKLTIGKYELKDVYVQGDARLLQTALLNILDNAVKYSSGEIQITLGGLDTEIVIGIIDHGIGIPVDELHRIRTPLFRATNAATIPGAGLGLALVERVMQVHHGKLEIISREGEGTRCLIRIKRIRN